MAIPGDGHSRRNMLSSLYKWRDLEHNKCAVVLGLPVVLYWRLKMVFWGKYLNLRRGSNSVVGKKYVMRSFHNLCLFTKNIYGYEITKEDERGGVTGGILVY